MKITIEITEKLLPNKRRLFKKATQNLDKLYELLDKDIEIFSVWPDEYRNPIAKITIESQSQERKK